MINKNTFSIQGMSCASCVSHVQETLQQVSGVEHVRVNLASHNAVVEYHNRVDVTDLQNAVRSIGYDLIVDEEDPKTLEKHRQDRYHQLKQKTIGSAFFTLPIVGLSMFFSTWEPSHWISIVLTLPIVFYFGNHFFIKAWLQIRRARAGMDLLVALSAGTSFLFSIYITLFSQTVTSHHAYYETASVIITLILLGKLLEERSMTKTSGSLRKLMSLQVSHVRVVKEGREQEIPVAEIQKGDQIIIKPGEKIPVDGRVRSGHSYIDEALISGESIPVKKEVGSQVLAGTINQQGSFLFEAEKVGHETLLAQIITKVKEAQNSRAPIQQVVDKIAAVFVPMIVIIAIGTCITWIWVGGKTEWETGMYSALTVIVMACPCALGLATPMAIMVGIGKGAENHILIRDAESLEYGRQVKTVVFDKTGTLTVGKPTVTDVLWHNPDQAAYYARVLYTLESRSNHPIAKAIMNRWKEYGEQEMMVFEHYENQPGEGVTATDSQGHIYKIGTEKLLEETSIESTDRLIQAAQNWQREGKTVIFFSDQKTLLATLAVSDPIKPTAKKVLEQLHDMQIETYLLTGDHDQTAKSIADQLSITNYRARMSPIDKADFIKNLQAHRKITAMVGDGINDSPALAQADVSMAFSQGSDIAMQVSTMIFMTPDLRSVVKALKISDQTVYTIRQNLFWAFLYNTLSLPLAAGVLYPFYGLMLNPMVAAGAMALSSLSVVINSLRLKYKKI